MSRAPFPSNPEEFDVDDRISYSKASETYVLEDERGDEWEWLSKTNKWAPVVCNLQAPDPDRLVWRAYKLPLVAGCPLT